MTVAENMGFALKMAGVSKTQRNEQVGRVAEVLRISELLGRYPKELSGGQRQRVAIGRAIVRNPKVFLFDEPLSNLDAALRVNMRSELSKLHKELGTTMIYVTHDQVEALTLGSRIAVFNKGHIEQLGAPMELYNRPANEFVATFIGAPRINLIERPPVVNASVPHLALWHALASAAPAAVQRAGLRPEHLHLAETGQGIPATVVLAEHLGDSSILHLQVKGVAELLHAKIDAKASHCETGQIVAIAPDAGWTLMFGADGHLIG
jgi:multiple sugar transport system ATP-binding protein